MWATLAEQSHCRSGLNPTFLGLPRESASSVNTSGRRTLPLFEAHGLRFLKGINVYHSLFYTSLCKAFIMTYIHLVSMSHLVAVFLCFISLLPYSSEAQAACNIHGPVSQGVVYQQAVSVNTFVQTNTTFIPHPEAQAITVTDAPTSIDLITTLSWTKTISYTASAPTVVSAAISTATDSSFILFIRSDTRLHQKRQNGFYMNANGTVSNDCSSAPTYSITNGVLTATINSVVYYYSTIPGVKYAPFVPSQTPESINTTFSATSNGQLSWFNSQFYNGQASFCSLNNGTVYAVFQQDAAPSGCMFIQLSLYSVSSCASLAMSSGPRYAFLSDHLYAQAHQSVAVHRVS